MTNTIPIPEKLNRDSCKHLQQALDKRLQSASPLLILEGSAGAFCSGVDLEEALLHPHRVNLECTVALFADCLKKIRLGSKPALALVDGPVRGGGIGLLSACDAVVATDRASFALPELLFGLVPALIWPFLVERLSPQVARRLALTGESFGPEWALRTGLIDEACDRKELEMAAGRWRSHFMRADPTAIQSLKKFTFRARASDLDAWFDQAIPLTVRHLTHPDSQSRIERFLSGEAPWHSAPRARN